jgi:hypothetical protein
MSTDAIILTIVTGLLSGGIVIAWIELQRHRHEKLEWKEKEKKVEIRIISAKSDIRRWNASRYDEKEKLRIFETGLDGKISYWAFLIQIVISNLLENDLLATEITLETPQPDMEMKENKNLKYEKNISSLSLIKYDLMKKDIINDLTLPLVIPAKSSTGVVFYGVWNFNYPFLTKSVPNKATFKMTLDDGTTRVENIDLIEVEYLSDIGTSASGEDHWRPYLIKNNIEEEIPF